MFTSTPPGPPARPQPRARPHAGRVPARSHSFPSVSHHASGHAGMLHGYSVGFAAGRHEVASQRGPRARKSLPALRHPRDAKRLAQYLHHGPTMALPAAAHARPPSPQPAIAVHTGSQHGGDGPSVSRAHPVASRARGGRCQAQVLALRPGGYATCIV
eukprot:3303295-Prymnesium_polylepis.1